MQSEGAQVAIDDIHNLAKRFEEERRAARSCVWPCDRDVHNRMADLYRARLEGMLRRLSPG
jgi:hypothetical protein